MCHRGATTGGRSAGASGALQRALLALLVAGWCCASPAAAQMTQPFNGQGDSPPSKEVDIYLSVFLDRLLAVDDNDYSFEAVAIIYASWTDPRVPGIIKDNQKKLQAGNYTCQSWCQSRAQELGGCCDGVWRPAIPLANVKALPQDSMEGYGIGYDAESGAVFEFHDVHAVWYTPMVFRAFPFDRQKLVIQLDSRGTSMSKVHLLPSAAGEATFSQKVVGDDVSGWAVAGIAMEEYAMYACSAPLPANVPSRASDPAPVAPLAFNKDPRVRANKSQCGNPDVLRGIKPRLSPLLVKYGPGLGPTGEPLVFRGINVIITVDRLWSRWVMSALFPVIATTWLSFLVFLLPRKDMEARLGAVIALFMALAAIQFVIDSGLPSSSYMTAMQMLTLTSYCVLVLVGAENVLIWYLCTYHSSKKAAERRLVAEQAINKRMTEALLDQALMDAMIDRLVAKPPNDPAAADDGGGHAARLQLASQLAAAMRDDQQRAQASPRRGGAGGGAGAEAEGALGSGGSGGRGGRPGGDGDMDDLESSHGKPQGQPRGGGGGGGGIGVGDRGGGGADAPRTRTPVSRTPSGRRAQPRWRLFERVRARAVVELHALREDTVYADRMSHIFNKWACLLQFIGYNVAVVLIFAVNAYVWR